MKGQPVAGPAEISGNGCILGASEEAGGWEITFASEPRTSPQPLWFHIEATGLSGAPVEFVWANPDICLGNQNELQSLRPVIRSDGEEWSRVAMVAVDEHADGRRSLRFGHPAGANAVSAAFCYPYAREHLDATLADLADAWERCVIGVTHEGRPLERLRLAGDHSHQRPGLYLMARQHSGETPGSLAMDGILRFLASDAEQAREIREALDVWICPFVDLDGVVNGDYGKDALPWDYNRAWERLPMRAAVHAIQRDLVRFKARTNPRLVLDLHGPGHSTRGVYIQLPRAERPEGQRMAALEYAADLAKLFPELPASKMAHETTYASRWNKLSTAGSWCWDYLEQTPCASVEISYQRLIDEPLVLPGYHDIGGRIIRAAHAWLAQRAGESD